MADMHAPYVLRSVGVALTTTAELPEPRQESCLACLCNWQPQHNTWERPILGNVRSKSYAFKNDLTIAFSI